MTTLIFYEKPGCGGNAKQRAWLEAAGHRLLRHDLLAEPWTRETLQPFLDGLPVAQWFNRAAPRIKCGEIVPEALTADAALALLLAEPLLIRRPLMQRTDTGARHLGFEPAAVEAFLGAGAARPAALEGCAAQAPGARCTPPDPTA